MTVKELIEELQKIDNQDLEVFAYCQYRMDIVYIIPREHHVTLDCTDGGY